MLMALLGGLLIGVSASIAWTGARKIAGISGIVGRFLAGDSPGRFALGFLAGLLVTSWVFARFSGPWLTSSLAPRPMLWLIVSGLIVGVGTQLANGCTSGHGVCGLSRGAPRSFVATLTFLSIAAVVVFVTRHALPGVAP